jgi:soluble lytic murein transglycosylase
MLSLTPGAAPQSSKRAAATGNANTLSQLAEGVQQYRGKAYAAAALTLEHLPGRLPQLSDYAAFYLGLSLFEQQKYTEAFAALQVVYKHPVPSPFAGNAVLTAADCLVQMDRAREALALLKQYQSRITPSEWEAANGKAYEAAGDLVSAAAAWQHVHYRHPTSSSAGDAALALARLRTQLGDQYPPVLGQEKVLRAELLSKGRRYAEARQELSAAIESLSGEQKDLAEVRLAAVDFSARSYKTAYTKLAKVRVDSPEADAERLYHLVATARRLDQESEMERWLRELDRKHPKSPWRAEALVVAAYTFLSRNEQDRYLPLYTACAEDLPDHPQASFCHWKSTWVQYLKNPADAERLFQDHMRRFPGSEKIPASLFFLGRAAEQKRDLAAARAYYSYADFHFPNHYYGVRSQQQLENAALAKAGESASTRAFLDAFPSPQRRTTVDFAQTPLTRKRLERARLLAVVPDLVELELRYAARNDGQPQVIAVELAKMLGAKGAHDQALRAIKGYVPKYLSFPWESAPVAFWRAAFPMPYREPLERHARLKSIDPFVVAGLIRQESEFNPKAISVAKAYGLTQVLPSTGRYLSKQTGIRRFLPKMLFEPEINLRLGTHYLRQQLDRWDSGWEQTLAAYNAGPSRVKRWIEWGRFEEPAEFIETIPIAETRDYVQIVMRNAVVYRRLYGAATAALPSENGPHLRADAQR